MLSRGVGRQNQQNNSMRAGVATTLSLNASMAALYSVGTKYMMSKCASETPRAPAWGSLQYLKVPKC